VLVSLALVVVLSVSMTRLPDREVR
jgi:hypothetical protein